MRSIVLGEIALLTGSVTLLLALVAFVPVRLFAGKYEPPKPIVTPVELAAAAAEVPVIRLDFTLPEEKDPMESDALSKRFFNQPEEMRYGGVISTDWRKKWDLFAKALVNKATANKRDPNSLEKCLRTLNHGRTMQTLGGYPMYCDPIYPPGTPEEKIKEDRKTGEKQVAKQWEEIRAHPERYYNESLAIIPVGAYLAKYAKGDCWIIVCKTGDSFNEKDLAKLPPETAQAALCMAHIMVWAMDTKTSAVVAYAGCD